jgi:hypothetical protein
MGRWLGPTAGMEVLEKRLSPGFEPRILYVHICMYMSGVCVCVRVGGWVVGCAERRGNVHNFDLLNYTLLLRGTQLDAAATYRRIREAFPVSEFW